MISDVLKVTGSWRQRMSIYGLTILLSLLFIWVLGFVLSDICSIKKPQWEDFEKTYLSKALVDKSKQLQKDINEKKAAIDRLNEQRRQLEESTKNAQVSIKQMDEKQKLLLQNGKTLSPQETEFNNANMAVFQKNQADDQKLAQEIITLTAETQSSTVALNDINSQLEKQREPAKKAYDKTYKKQLIIEASIQIAFLLSVLLIATYLLLRYRKTNYKMLLLALFVASIYKIIFVVHNYFPSEYFKYTLVLALIIVIGKTLLRFVHNANSSQPEILLKRYKEAYANFLCPNCEFPIRRGPMKYLYWNSRSLPKLGLSISDNLNSEEKEEAYTCPACGTGLFSTCQHCKEIRYSLLPVCQHCSKQP